MFAIRRLGSQLVAVALATGALAVTGVVRASAQDLPAFTCSDKSGGAATSAGTVSDIRIAHHDGYDRLVIGFSTAGAMPQYQLNRQDTAHFVRDASGVPVTLDGSAGIRIVLRNTDVAPGAPNDLTPNLPEIREVAQIGNFERVVSYGVGLATPACVRVLELSGPTRLVIDVQTPPEAAAASAAPSSPTPSSATSPSTASTATGLAGTGQPARPAQPATVATFALVLGLLALTGGLAIAGIKRFARK